MASRKGVTVILTKPEQMPKNICAVIFADGDGKQMKSAGPTALCQVLFKPMVSWVLDSAMQAGIRQGCVIAGAEAGRILPLLPQEFPLVTSGAAEKSGLILATEYIRTGGFAHMAILPGNTLLLDAEDISRPFTYHISEDRDLTILIPEDSDPADDKADPIALWCKADFLLKALENLTDESSRDELCIGDILSFSRVNDYKTGKVAIQNPNAQKLHNRKALAALNRAALEKVLDCHMENGVDIPFPDGIVIGPDVEISPDTIILPGTILRGRTVIGSGCEIGPNSYLDNAVVKDNCRVISSYIDSSVVEAGVRIGPMSNLRPDSHIHENVKIGDFVEVKNSTIGAETSIAHLTYIGDSDVGRNVNFGCGVVTVNYDGKNKHRTTIGDHAFIGCNTNLVAPVKVGDRAYSAAGTTITEDVPEGALVIGRARQSIKENWSSLKLDTMRSAADNGCL